MKSVKRGDEITTTELRETLKISNVEFAEMIGITRQSLWNKEQGTTLWTMPELVKIAQIMDENSIKEKLTVSIDGISYRITIHAKKMPSVEGWLIYFHNTIIQYLLC